MGEIGPVFAVLIGFPMAAADDGELFSDLIAVYAEWLQRERTIPEWGAGFRHGDTVALAWPADESSTDWDPTAEYPIWALRVKYSTHRRPDGSRVVKRSLHWVDC